MLRVTIQEKNGQREELSFDNQPNKELIIGRVPTNEIPLPKNNVSKRHAKIVWNHGFWELQDLKSTNGTFVNGQQVDHHRLAPGDQVIIGDFLLMFEMTPVAPAVHASQPGMPMPSHAPTMGGPAMPMSTPGMPQPPMPGMNPGMPMGMNPNLGQPPGMGMGMPTQPPPGIGAPPGMGMPMPVPPPGIGAPPGMGMPMPVQPGGTGGFPPGPMAGRPTAPPTFPGAGMPGAGMPGAGMPSAPPGFPPAPGRMPNLGQPVPPPTIPPMSSSPGLPAQTGELGPPPPKVETPSHGDLVGRPATALPAVARFASVASEVVAGTPQDMSAPIVHRAEAPATPAFEPALDTVSPEVAVPSRIAEPEHPKSAPVPSSLSSAPVEHSATQSSMDDISAATPLPVMAEASEDMDSEQSDFSGEFDGSTGDMQSWSNTIRSIRQQLQARYTGLALRPLDPEDPQRQELFQTAQKLATDAVQAENAAWDVQELAEAAVRETAGWGPLEDLLHDESIATILIHGAQNISVERNGEHLETDLQFSGQDALQQTLERILAPHGIRLHRNHPVVEARLNDGTWIHVISPPVANRGISVVIQPPRSHWMDLDDLIEAQLLDPAMALFLQVCVQNRCNTLISGDPGSGRTTLLRALAEQISGSERIISIEHVPEIQLEHPHWISLSAQPSDLSGHGGISCGDLVPHALRMKAQRLILGDLQGDMLPQLLPRMILGLNGILATTRANSPDQMIDRLTTILSAAHLGEPHHQLGQAFDIVVQVNQFACGTRKITSINELSVTSEGNLLCQELFSFIKEGVNELGQIQGHFVPTGVIPLVYQRLATLGQELDTSIFLP